MTRFNTENLSDPVVRENFKRLSDEMRTNPFLSGAFRRLEVKVESANAHFRYKHLLGFRPTDVIITWVSQGTASVVYSETDSDVVVLNVSQPSTVRLIIGTVRD